MLACCSDCLEHSRFQDILQFGDGKQDIQHFDAAMKISDRL
jgi:hypothetical protein